MEQPGRGVVSACGGLRVVTAAELPGWRLIGEVDLSTLGLLTAVLESGIGGTGDLHLDLSELAFIDIVGVTALVNAAWRLHPGRRLVLRRVPPLLRRIVQVAWGRVPGLELVEG